MRTITYLAATLLLVQVISLSSGFDAQSQEGNPYLSHFQLPAGVSNQNWGFVQGENNLMYVLNRKGIFSFDGIFWENLGVQGRPIAIAYNKWLFFCTDKGVGYFRPNDDGSYSQHLLLESQGTNIFYKFNYTDNGLLVVSPQTICRIQINDDVEIDTLYYENRPEVFISDFFSLNNNMYHVKNRALIYLNKPDGSYEMLDGLPIGEDMIFSFIHDENAYFGSTNNTLYQFDGKKLSPVNLEGQEYVNASILNGGISLSPSTYALSTLNGGCLLINSEDGSTLNTLNFFNGLPDDEVYSLGSDREGGLWISHGMGITRADIALPVRAFANYTGLRGNILSCIEYKGTLFVGTSEGLFLLDEHRDYKAVDVTVQRRRTVQKEKKTEPSTQREPESIEEKKRGFLSRLFTRKTERSSDAEVAMRADTKSQQSLHEREIEPKKRTIYQLQSISHLYKKIEGVDGKVNQLFAFKGKLYAATNFGLYEIENQKGKLVVSEKNIVFAQVSLVDDDIILLGTDNGAYFAELSRGYWKISPILFEENLLVVSMLQADEENFLVSTEFDIYLAKRICKSSFEINEISITGTEYSSPVVRWINGKIFAFSSSGVFEYDADGKEFLLADELNLPSDVLMLFNQSEYTWFKHQREWFCHASSQYDYPFNTQFLSLLSNPNYICFTNDSTIYAINGYTQLYRIITQQPHADDRSLSVFIKGVFGKEGNLLDTKDIHLDYARNALRIKISAPSYFKEGSVMFSYRISGIFEDWSDWSSDPQLDFPYFPSGDYTLFVKARDILGNESPTLAIPFQVKPPFWQTLWFYALCVIAVVALFVLFVKIRERKLRKEKEILEEKVRQRTKTIQEQKEVLQQQHDDLAKYNEEILQQKEEIEAQRDEIEVQRDQIFKQNEEITQSITYARKIQTAVMPSKEMANCLLNESFILFRPRDIVSGDFYWITEKDDSIIVVAADCTGHGVPGAFMSMMGVSFLNDIVMVEGIVQPHDILNALRQKILSTFGQLNRKTETSDGMDIAVCVFDKKIQKLQYSGAYNPLYIIRNHELIEFKADKMPVGAHPKQNQDFSAHQIELEEGDNLYIFSDGYVDQFGGPEGRKFMAKPFKNLLLKLHGKSMMQQQKVLEDELDKWQNAYEQVDDILVVGIAIK